MKIVVDTNIIFSSLLNSDGVIGDLIFNSSKHFEFYSCSYMRFEIQKHWGKLKKISKLYAMAKDDEQVSESIINWELHQQIMEKKYGKRKIETKYKNWNLK